MKEFVVGHIDWFDHELVLERVQALDWKGAIMLHTKCRNHFPDGLPNTLEEVKQEAFNQDAIINVLEIKELRFDSVVLT